MRLTHPKQMYDCDRCGAEYTGAEVEKMVRWNCPRCALSSDGGWLFRRIPRWEKILGWLCDAWELTDHEAILGTVRGPYPFIFFLTVWDLWYRRSRFRRFFPWRIRCSIAPFVRNFVYSRCTKCHNRFTLRELISRSGNLSYFQSGSIAHNSCEGAK